MNPRSALPAAIAVGAALGLLIAAVSEPGAPPSLTPALATPLLEARHLPIVENEPVRRFLDLFQHRQPDRIALYLKRSGRYEGMIRSKLRERGMPEDLLYLSMIESGFNPNARSDAQAVGLWQFMADTGRRYGLRIDTYVDERRDPEKSTDAALRYLQDLYEQFGSWSLAAAAYNSGENRIARIMREETGSVRGGETDFWRIRNRLPSETREYVPLVFAAILIGKNPQKYGLHDVERLLPTEVETVQVPGGTPLSAVASAVGIPASHLELLNPHLVRAVVPLGDPYPVRVPNGTAAAFAGNFVPAPVRAD